MLLLAFVNVNQLFEGKKVKSIVLASLVFLTVPAMAQDAAAGKTKYASCAGCHGAVGQGGMAPKLAGQTSEAIEQKLIAYKNRQKVGAQSAMMWGFAAALSSDDIKNISAYTASLK